MSQQQVPVSHLRTLQFTGPEEYEVIGFAFCERKAYDGYDPEKGDILDAAVLGAFNQFKRAEWISHTPVYSQSDIEYGINHIKYMSQHIHNLHFRFTPKGINSHNKVTVKCHELNLDITFYMTFHIASELALYYYSFNSISIDHDRLDELYNTIIFH